MAVLLVVLYAACATDAWAPSPTSTASAIFFSILKGGLGLQFSLVTNTFLSLFLPPPMVSSFPCAPLMCLHHHSIQNLEDRSRHHSPLPSIIIVDFLLGLGFMLGSFIQGTEQQL
ncbi:hypothetical protein LR48_Vigan10g074000 [Vigna angularis]|uniref:WAT1-related protein n=1 Tax=Phaseolus angularis TaxID=3914 RepID=A0A0L9VIN6_PHAAN|nr:hypothetical protein LR48_Vigan10g074000 [Vigna angularis]